MYSKRGGRDNVRIFLFFCLYWLVQSFLVVDSGCNLMLESLIQMLASCLICFSTLNQSAAEFFFLLECLKVLTQLWPESRVQAAIIFVLKQFFYGVLFFLNIQFIGLSVCNGFRHGVETCISFMIGKFFIQRRLFLS